MTQKGKLFRTGREREIEKTPGQWRGPRPRQPRQKRGEDARAFLSLLFLFLRRGEREGGSSGAKEKGEKNSLTTSDVARGRSSLLHSSSFVSIEIGERKKKQKAKPTATKDSRHGLFCSQRLRSRRRCCQQRCALRAEREIKERRRRTTALRERH